MYLMTKRYETGKGGGATSLRYVREAFFLGSRQPTAPEVDWRAGSKKKTKKVHTAEGAG